VSVSERHRPLRIGEVAERLGITARTIRYYEEIGLLPAASDRPGGGHRLYDEADVERLAEILRLKNLLGLSLDELRGLLEAEEARRLLRERWHATEDPLERREILQAAIGHVERQLALVRTRRTEIDKLEAELGDKRRRLRSRLAALEKERA
jgi:DNA-binding transcriptional MerR regulator